MKGGSYSIPLRPEDRPAADYDLNILTAHGEITPDYYYIVPDNTIIILPNACGLVLKVDESAADYLFMEPTEAKAAFERDFMTTTGKRRAPFTAYFPGDIMPLHLFTFSPLLHIYPGQFTMGFVGVFKPGALYKK